MCPSQVDFFLFFLTVCFLVGRCLVFILHLRIKISQWVQYETLNVLHILRYNTQHWTLGTGSVSATVNSTLLLTPSVAGRAKLCGRFWSIATMEMSKPAQEETVWPPSATARWLREARGNHPQVCKTMCHQDGKIEMTDLLKLGHCHFKL